MSPKTCYTCKQHKTDIIFKNNYYCSNCASKKQIYRLLASRTTDPSKRNFRFAR